MKLVGHAIRLTLILVAVVMAALLTLRAAFLSWPDQLPLIAHAGGRIGGQDYTNAIAALDLSYSKGFRLFEIDFQTTSDGHAVCGHDWNAFRGRPPALDGFLEWRRRFAYPPCTIDELTDWFARHPEAILVTDAKDSTVAINTMLVALLPGRVIVQAYSRDELCAYADRGMERVMLTLYRSPVRRGDLASYAGEPCPGGRRADAVVMNAQRALGGQALEVKLSTDLPVYVHTVNGCVAAWLMLLVGADSLFTDTVAPGRCLLPDRGRS